ncbi:MAG: AAA family ATPase [Muribaculaceae bacterium]|nr:AAA family ATPase [Muribaculaceae bacterium]
MENKREILKTLKEWKRRDNRKPILLKGARQIGKSWVLEKFGQECFDYYVKLDFDRQKELKSVFANTKEPERIIKELALFTDVPIQPDKTG